MSIINSQDVINFAIANNKSFEYYTNLKDRFGDNNHPVTHIGVNLFDHVWYWFELSSELKIVDSSVYKTEYYFNLDSEINCTNRYNQVNGSCIRSLKQRWKAEDIIKEWLDSCGVVEDEKGNKNYFGEGEKYETKEVAQVALESLQDCENCIDCENLRLSDDCINCSWGLWLTSCKDCKSTQYSSNCRNLENCQQMSNCINLAYCYGGKNENGHKDSLHFKEAK